MSKRAGVSSTPAAAAAGEPGGGKTSGGRGRRRDPLPVLVAVYAAAVVYGIIFFLGTLFMLAFVGPLKFVLISLFNARRLASTISDHMLDAYWTAMVWSVERLLHSPVQYWGDAVPPRESAVVVGNHQFAWDWLGVFSLAVRKGRCGSCKFFMKDVIKYVPAFGLGMWLFDHIYLHRRWADDADQLAATFAALRDRQLPAWVVSWPEGTRVTAAKIDADNRHHAAASGAAPHRHVITPKSRGFVATVQSLRGSVCGVVYDITMAFEGQHVPSPVDVILRRSPLLHVYVRRFDIAQLPDDDDGLRQWLLRVWREKDDLLEYFARNGRFPGEPRLNESQLYRSAMRLEPQYDAEWKPKKPKAA